MKLFRATVDFTVNAVFVVVAEDEDAAATLLPLVSIAELEKALHLAVDAGVYEVNEDTVTFEDTGEASGSDVEGDIRSVRP